MACDKRRADQAKQSRIFLIMVRERLLEPFVVTALGNTKFPTHRLHAIWLSMAVMNSYVVRFVLDLVDICFALRSFLGC